MKNGNIENLIKKEKKRQEETINLIASENYVSEDVLNALGSVFTNKYAEGYPGARYYGGNEVVDELEICVKEKALNLFDLDKGWSVNVQPYSGSPANLVVYHALVPKGEKIMGMKLSMGGHLTHGHNVSLSGKLWSQVEYGVDKETERLDYEKIREKAKSKKPKLIIAGYTAYPREIDFKKFREIADEVGAVLMADISHIAGLVAAGEHPSPFPYVDIVTTTTHKTLRGPRSALIFSREDFSEDIDKMVFPGMQGGPHVNQIAAVGVALDEAGAPEFKEYIKQVVLNARTLSEEMKDKEWRIVSGGTDNHLMLVDVSSKGVSGKESEDLLSKAGIIVNKNTIPFDDGSPRDPSGIRMGTPAVTTRGIKEEEMKEIGLIVDTILKGNSKCIKEKVKRLCDNFPIYK